MTWLSDISLLRPFWLLALPVIAALAVISMRRRSALGDWSAHIDPHLMAAMAALAKIDTQGAQRLRQLPFWGAAIICVGLSGPALERGNGQTFRNLDGVIFVMDVSPSMTGDESWPAAITMAQAGLNALGTKPAALIIYAGDSYPASSLTLDHVQLAQTVALLDEKTVPDRGTRPAIAMQQAADMLATSDILAGDVVLITDGDGLGPETLTAARAIVEQGGRISVVHVPTVVSGRPAIVAARVEAVAELGGGRTYGVADVEALMATLSESSEKRLEKQDFQLLFWSDYGRYLMLLALFPVAAMFRREQV